MTIPLGEGIHRRMVYVELEEGANLEDVTKELKADDYFTHDELHVFVSTKRRSFERCWSWRSHDS